jgi:hypothetical protein
LGISAIMADAGAFVPAMVYCAGALCFLFICHGLALTGEENPFSPVPVMAVTRGWGFGPVAFWVFLFFAVAAGYSIWVFFFAVSVGAAALPYIDITL